MSISSIMIVDDSESDQFLTKIVIEKFDDSIEISQAYDGEEALEQLRAMDQQPEIILLDINMPRMNGFEFLEKYNSWEHRAKVIAMLTSSDQEKDQEQSKKFDCVKTYILKPLDFEDIKALAEI